MGKVARDQATTTRRRGHPGGACPGLAMLQGDRPPGSRERLGEELLDRFFVLSEAGVNPELLVDIAQQSTGTLAIGIVLNESPGKHTQMHDGSVGLRRIGRASVARGHAGRVLE